MRRTIVTGRERFFRVALQFAAALAVLIAFTSPAVAESTTSSELESYVHDTSLFIKGSWITNYFHNDTRIYRLARDAAGEGNSSTNYEAASRINRYITSRKFYDDSSKYWSSDLDIVSSADWGRGMYHGVCIDFAALEVSLLRSLAIPSRVIYADFDFETGKGHAWVEFWDAGRGWVPSDPTFGTFDLPKYYCYLGYDVGGVHTVLNSTNVPVTPGSRYSECTKQSPYLELIILVPVTLAVMIAGIILFRNYVTALSEDDGVENATDEGVGKLITRKKQ